MKTKSVSFTKWSPCGTYDFVLYTTGENTDDPNVSTFVLYEKDTHRNIRFKPLTRKIYFQVNLETGCVMCTKTDWSSSTHLPPTQSDRLDIPLTTGKCVLTLCRSLYESLHRIIGDKI